MKISTSRRQRGSALPVMLIVLAVMLVTSVYMLKSSNSTTMSAANLAYDSQQSRAADYGLHIGFEWLNSTAAANKTALNDPDPANGYHANINPGLTPSAKAFWEGSRTVADPSGKQIEFVVHRLCRLQGPYDVSPNTCMQTAANTAALGNPVALGMSLAADAPAFTSSPMLHFVVTARIAGARGGNVVNQLVVLIGA
jgi:hypothetical protein